MMTTCDQCLTPSRRSVCELEVDVIAADITNVRDR